MEREQVPPSIVSSPAETWLDCTRVDGSHLRVRWGVSRLDQSRTGAGAGAEWVMRCVSLRADSGGVLEREVTERSGASGDVGVDVHGPGRCVLAVGLLTGDDFASVIHHDEGAH
jgi:hypothetical protein